MRLDTSHPCHTALMEARPIARAYPFSNCRAVIMVKNWPFKSLEPMSTRLRVDSSSVHPARHYKAPSYRMHFCRIAS